MKKHLPQNLPFPSIFLYAWILLIGAVGCQDEVISTYTYTTQVPVTLQVSSFRNAEVVVEPGRPLDNIGKIYLYGDYLFVGAPGEGIHILDNTNPASPKNLNFIPIEGTGDLAINSNILYADNYIDLLAFDISDPSNITLVKREEDVFPTMYSNREEGIIVTYKDTVITSSEGRMSIGFWGRPAFRNDMMAFSGAESAGRTGQSYGQGGSMARFTLLNNHLYTVDHYHLRVFDVDDPKDPKFLTDISLGWGIETIFPFQDKLFIGSMTGMFIYDASDPARPKQMSRYDHITACDPVVANETHAFVTLRSGVACRLGVDELHVLDIVDPYQPKLVKTYPMDNPHGLGLSGKHLYIAEANHGLKSFDVSNVLDVKPLEHLTEIKSIDIIPGPKSLIVIGPEGVCQYDYSDPDKLRKLSCVAVNNPQIR
ncbi:LVIVD repeat-containing protein [Lunatimonas salinarum]|uniref:LVIVD repeat-containing protein n=1 Tax=Lunatimonas salinarum TaxID=1774590 RepID=UPI001ADF35BB|nr:hypothetical protein [Lunatimonas salinarum]